MPLATTPFQQNGLTYLIAASETPALGKQVPVFPSQYGGQYYIVNNGEDIVWLCAGADAVSARDGAQPAIPNLPSLAIALIPGTAATWSFAETAYFSAYSVSPTDVFITQGLGS
jgi:hypothetical protein